MNIKPGSNELQFISFHIYASHSKEISMAYELPFLS